MGSKSEFELFKEHSHFLTLEGSAFPAQCAPPLVPKGCIGHRLAPTALRFESRYLPFLKPLRSHWFILVGGDGPDWPIEANNKFVHVTCYCSQLLKVK